MITPDTIFQEIDAHAHAFRRRGGKAVGVVLGQDHWAAFKVAANKLLKAGSAPLDDPELGITYNSLHGSLTVTVRDCRVGLAVHDAEGWGYGYGEVLGALMERAA